MITLRDVSASYGGKNVLSRISLSVSAGDFIALLGPNGSGKSTLLKILSGQLVPISGAVSLNEKALRDFEPKRRAQFIAYFPQSRPTPNMDVRTLVAHGRFPRLGFGRVMGSADNDAVEEAIAQTEMEEFVNRPLSSLSGGERQRAYLAMLIAQGSEILLLDEPGSFLDIRHQIEVMDILKRLNLQGKTVVFAAHDLPLAFSYAKRIVLLNGGSLADDAPPELLASRKSIENAFSVRLERHNDNSLFQYILTESGRDNLETNGRK